MEYIKGYNDDFTCDETICTANSTNKFSFLETIIENNLNISNLSNRTEELKYLDDEINRLKISTII